MMKNKPHLQNPARPTGLIAVARKQSGIVLLEGLIAILIFSIGILAMVGLQAVSIKNSADAKYRNEAAFFANQVIGQMWADNKTSLSTDYASPSGTKYIVWRNEVTNATGLPGAASNLPTISFGSSNLVTVTVFWRAPQDNQLHNHVAVAQINGND